MATPNIKLPLVPNGQTNLSVAFNEAMQMLDMLYILKIQDKDLTAPPTTTFIADLGKVWYVATGATGDWATHDGQLAVCVGDDLWAFIDIPDLIYGHMLDEATDYRWVGAAWVPAGLSSVAFADITGAPEDNVLLDAALDAKLDASEAGVSIATLVSGKVPSGQLPSYTDDVLEVANYAALPGTGETGKIYVTIDNNKQFRWSGSVYVELVPMPSTSDAVPEGSTNLYHTAARVRATVLTGLSLAAGTVVAATHTVLEAIGFLQKQITDLAAVVAGISSGSDRSTVTVVTSASGIVTLDYSAGDYFTLTLSENVTGWAISNPPGSGHGFTLMVQCTQGSGPYTVSDPGTTAGDEPLDVSTAAGAVDIIAISSFNNGTTLRSSIGRTFS